MELDIRAIAEKLIEELSKVKLDNIAQADKAHAKAEGVILLFERLVEENNRLRAPKAESSNEQG
jgi:hypothetical protein